MIDAISDLLSALCDFTKEILAIISDVAAFLSVAWAIIGFVQSISQQGVVQGSILWLVGSIITSVISGMFAEILDSSIPTPFRLIVKLIEDILEILGLI